MKKETKQLFWLAAGLLTAFAAWTAALCLVDVQAIGPQGSQVGLATVNRWIHDLTGVHMTLYEITDWLGLVPIGGMLGFAMLGLVQWIRRKGFGRVDRSLLVLGGFYLVVMAAYVLFEAIVINYRPVLIEGVLEASYPSSTTMLVLCVMPTAITQLRERIRNRTLRRCVVVTLGAFAAFMVIGRFLSGVHWFTDIVGGTLLSMGLVAACHGLCTIITK